MAVRGPQSLESDHVGSGGLLSAHRAEFERAEPDPGYTGDVGACVAGTTSRAFRDSELQRINWYRRMAGVDVVVESADSTVAAQRAAIMMMAAGELTHEPSATWPCYGASGADGASKSNLGLGNAGVAAVDAYVRDGGSGNERVGHRGWVLSPYVRAIGMGAAFGSSSANALHVLGDLTGSPDRLREVRGFVAWPPPGHVPAATVFRRWSFRLFGDFDFLRPRRSLWVGDGGPVRIDIVHRGDASSHLPRPALVWELADVPTHGSMPEPAGGDECYTVTITGVRSGGVVQDPYDYRTCLLDLRINSTGTVPSANGTTDAAANDVEDVELRIVARRVAAGRVEFGLQQQEPDGSWSRRLLPSQRFFPLDTRVGHWLVSTPLAVGAAADGAPGDGPDVRIVARRVAAGRVEFGLQRQEFRWGLE